MKSYRNLLRCGLSVAFALSAGSAFSSTAYRVEILPTFSSDYPSVSPAAIGPNGEVVGTAYFLNSDTGGSKAVIWNNAGQISEFAPSAFESSATDINQNGQTAVTADAVSYIVQNGTFTPLFPNGTFSTSTGINKHAQVTGYYTISGHAHAFIATNGAVTDLGTYPGDAHSYAFGINNLGQVVGYSYDGAGKYHAVLWSNGTVIDLGTLPGYTNSTANAINDKGQIVGTASNGYPTYGTRAFLWENGVMTDLGPIGGYEYTAATDINSTGQITGSARNASSYRSTAYVLHNGIFTNINAVVGNTSGGCYASSINDAGQVTGLCSGQPYRLTPTQVRTDVGVDITSSASTVTIGAAVTFNVAVVNTGTTPLSGVSLVDTLPLQMALIGATASQGTCSGTASVSCALGDLAPGATAYVKIEVNTTGTNYNIANSVTVSASETESYSANNSATTYVTIYPRPVIADISVTSAALQNPVPRRGNITYNVVVKNAGPETAKAVTLFSGVSNNPVSLVSYTVSRGSCTYISGDLRCSLGDMGNGDTATLTFTVKPKYSFSFLTYTNTASVSSTTQDNNTSNNYASTTVSVK